MKKLLLIFAFLLALSPVFMINNVYATDDDDERNADFMYSDYYKYCGGDDSEKALIKNIPSIVPTITSGIYNAVLVIVPLILVIMGSIDLFRASISQNEDEIRKGKINFMKRLIIGIITFLIVLLTKFFVSAMSKDQARIINCVDCFINNTCEYMPVNTGVTGEENPKSNSTSKSNSNSSSNSNSKRGSGGKF